MLKSKILVLALLVNTIIYSQGGFRTRFYSSPHNGHVTRAVFETSPGQYIGLGLDVETNGGVPLNHLAVVGMNSIGDILWCKRHGSASFEYLNSPAVNRSSIKIGNHIYYTGTVRSSGKEIGVLVKFDLSGEIVWQQTYQDLTTNIASQKVIQSVDGGFLITGCVVDMINHAQPCILIKTNSLGQELWRKIYHKPTPDASDGKAIIQDSASKKIVIVGYQFDYSNHSVDNLLILDSLGVKQNQYSFLADSGGRIMDLIQTKDNKFVAAGLKKTNNFWTNSDFQEAFIVKFDLATPTQPIWMIDTFGLYCKKNAFDCITELTNGDILAGGVIDRDTTTLSTRVRYSKFSPTGKHVSSSYHDYSHAGSHLSSHRVYSMDLTSDGGWVAAIGSFYSDQNAPLFFVKYDSTACDSTTAYCLNKVGIDDPEFDPLVQMFPNPADDAIALRCSSCSSGQNVIFKVLNQLGQIVKVEDVVLTEDLATIDTQDLPNGIYTLLLTTEHKTNVSKRFVVSH